MKNAILGLLTGLLMTGSLCLSAMQRASAGMVSVNAISELIHRSKLNLLLAQLVIASTALLFALFKIEKVRLIIDETQVPRSKAAKAFYGLFRSKDRKNNGTINGQEWLTLVIVAKGLTIPVLALPYRPDPDLQEWTRNDKKLRKQGVPKKQRPPKPPRNPDFPSKHELAAKLLRQFKYKFSRIKVVGVLADCLYGTKCSLTSVKRIYPNCPFVSQLKKNQLARNARGSYASLDSLFPSSRLHKTTIMVRGKEKSVEIGSARLQVKALACRVHVVALRYEGEKECRFVFTQDLSLTQKKILEIYSERWLIEVCFQDWKCAEGFGSDRLQAQEGAFFSVSFSLLFDHFIQYVRFHEGQVCQGLGSGTSGSVIRELRLRVIQRTLVSLIISEDPQSSLDSFMASLRSFMPRFSSRRHLEELSHAA